MRIALGAFALSTALAAFGCVLLTGGTEDYRTAEPEAGACDAGVTAATVPDAAIGDAGATVPGCFGCLQRACSAELGACQASCPCIEAVGRLLLCLSAGRSTTDCSGEALAAGASTELLALGSCLQRSGCAAAACGALDAGP